MAPPLLGRRPNLVPSRRVDCSHIWGADKTNRRRRDDVRPSGSARGLNCLKPAAKVGSCANRKPASANRRGARGAQRPLWAESSAAAQAEQTRPRMDGERAGWGKSGPRPPARAEDARVTMRPSREAEPGTRKSQRSEAEAETTSPAERRGSASGHRLCRVHPPACRIPSAEQRAHVELDWSWCRISVEIVSIQCWLNVGLELAAEPCRMRRGVVPKCCRVRVVHVLHRRAVMCDILPSGGSGTTHNL